MSMLLSSKKWNIKQQDWNGGEITYIDNPYIVPQIVE